MEIHKDLNYYLNIFWIAVYFILQIYTVGRQIYNLLSQPQFCRVRESNLLFSCCLLWLYKGATAKVISVTKNCGLFTFLKISKSQTENWYRKSTPPFWRQPWWWRNSRSWSANGKCCDGNKNGRCWDIQEIRKYQWTTSLTISKVPWNWCPN